MAVDYEGIIAIQRIEAETDTGLMLNFNDGLDRKANILSLNERALVGSIEKIDKVIRIKDEFYWLTMARINELALFCAGNYADNCEFVLVGDLLLNPRTILLQIPKLNKIVIKKRHTALTGQFQHVADNLQGVQHWLKTETQTHSKVEALLPDLLKRLANSGYLDQEYLDSIEQRQVHISELIGFLAAGGITDSVELQLWLKKAGPAERELLESKLCRFDLERFFTFGWRIRELSHASLKPNWTPENVFRINGFSA